MKFLNLNAIQTYLSIALAVLAVLLGNLGCTLGLDGKFDCSQAIISPSTLGYIAMATSFLKFVVIPAIQPGGWFRNMFEVKVPVSDSGATGTVAPEDVKA